MLLRGDVIYSWLNFSAYAPFSFCRFFFSYMGWTGFQLIGRTGNMDITGGVSRLGSDFSFFIFYHSPFSSCSFKP